MNISSKFIVGFLILGDALLLGFTLLTSIIINKENYFSQFDWWLFVVLTGLWFTIVFWRKHYITGLYESFGRRIVNFLKSSSILIFILGLVYFTFTFPPDFRNVVIAFSVGFPLAGIITNFFLIGIVNRMGWQGKNLKHALVAGVNETAQKVNAYYNLRPNSGYKIEGFVSYKNEKCEVDQDRILGDINHLKAYLKENHVDEILIALPIKRSKRIQSILDIADYHGTRVQFIPDYQGVNGENKFTRRGGLYAIYARQMPLDDRKSYFIKEFFDWCFSSIVLFFMIPLFLLIAILIKIDSPRPVFYCPVRIGKCGKPFKVYKFSTMKVNDSESGGKISTMVNDPRITKFGKILRKYSLDELPQFINVFLGEMSVVGPRPHRIFLNQQFQESEGNYMIRHYFKPGITGWAQVNGWRGPTNTVEQKHQRTVHDLWYLENWSMKLDIKIIFMTVMGKKTHKGTY